MEATNGGTTIRRRIGLLFAVSLAVMGLAASPASAEDEGHTHEKFSFTDTFETGGTNPCLDAEEFGLARVVVSVDSEVENGRIHDDVNVTGSVEVNTGYQGTFSEQDNAEIDASGNGKVELEWNFKLQDPDTGDKFEVHGKALLTIAGFQVVDAQDEVKITKCDRG